MQLIKNIKKFPMLLIFMSFILAFAIADLILPDKAFSAAENRNLQQKPVFTMESLFNNSYSANYETYINDQFIMRDKWIDLKSLTETALYKIENNGIIYGKNDYSFIKKTTVNEDVFNTNVTALQKFAQNNAHATIALVPSASNILISLLPKNSPVANEKKLQQFIEQNLAAEQFTDLFPTLEAHRDEYIYYKTDHHWTTLGAYYAYAELCRDLQLVAMQPADYKTIIINDFLGSHFRKAKRLFVTPDSITLYDIPVLSVDTNDKLYDSLYDTAQLNKEDKYAGIIYGNNGLTTIQTPKATGKKGSLLIIKDSFANSIVPFFAANYDTITMIDLRYFNPPLSAWLKIHSYDDILVLYNFDSLQGETNLFKLGK